MARYVAVQPIYFGSALAFAAGAQVPEDHVERFRYLDAGWVQQVDDDHRGDAPDLVPAQPDNTPPSLTLDRYLDEDARRVERAQRNFIAEQAAQAPPAPEQQAPAAADKPKRTATVKPTTADTTSPVKEG